MKSALKLLTALLLALLAPAHAADPLEALDEKIAKLPIKAHFDLLYAGTTNPKQMLDLYLPQRLC